MFMVCFKWHDKKLLQKHKKINHFFPFPVDFSAKYLIL